MNPFIKTGIDKKVARFYDKHYSFLYFKLLNDEDWFFLGNQTLKKCRFCRKTEEDGAKFNEIAHCLPESIGNHFFASYYECDKCNAFFGKRIESEYATYMKLYHSVFHIHGKKTVPDHIGTDCKSKTTWYNDKPIISEIAPDSEDASKELDNDSPVIDSGVMKHVEIKGNIIEYSDTAPPHIPIAVFKCFVKMAISIMPEEELSRLEDTISWLTNKKHTNIFFPKKLLCRVKMIPGYNTTKYPCVQLFKRKGPSQCAIYPLYVFNLTYGNLSFLIEVPIIEEPNQKITSIPFPDIPFITEKGGKPFVNSKFI